MGVTIMARWGLPDLASWQIHVWVWCRWGRGSTQRPGTILESLRERRALVRAGFQCKSSQQMEDRMPQFEVISELTGVSPMSSWRVRINILEATVYG